MNAHTLLYIRQITNKDVLYSTRNSTECSEVTYMRKESKENEYMHTESLCCTPEANTTL